MQINRTRRSALAATVQAAFLCALLTSASLTQAQSAWPNKQVRIVVPFAPAGTTESAPASAPATKAVPAAVSDFDDDEPPVATAPVTAPTAAAPTQKAEDILAMIRARQQK